MTILVTAAVVVLALILISVAGFIVYKKKKGVHILQEAGGCEWDDETGEVKGFVQYGYDGEDLLVLDLNTFTWIALRPEADIAKPIWEADKDLGKKCKTVLTQNYPERLKKYLDYGRSFLLRTELPSVSLLQKTPSSPVSCHATGFYPHRASLFWRKDGEELHEEVDHGEILPNHDGTFQMSVDLNLSSVTPEDWTRYDCVFQFSGEKEDIITKLEKDRIRTNWVKPSDMTIPVTAAVVVLALILIGAAGFIVYKKKKAIRPPSFAHSPRVCVGFLRVLRFLPHYSTFPPISSQMNIGESSSDEASTSTSDNFVDETVYCTRELRSHCCWKIRRAQ
ncbi:major histocompatibility complex class I-related gene protein-like [Pagrus major]|uniref:major histocompatibility complex class I-related gene protein-like n=1 Tax=Pagrus major TaxID=143350 RepID=UPI003CC87596